MQILNSKPVITEELFEKTIKHIDSFCKKVIKPCNRKMILTEADLQAWIFHDLLCNIGKESGLEDNPNSKAIGIHCNPSFLGSIGGNLTIVPDIVIFDKKEYDVDSSDELCKRKGYSFWGSSIVLELKLFRTHHSEVTQLKKWKEDIDKLMNLKTNLYPQDQLAKFFPAFVLVGNKNIDSSSFYKIEEYAIEKKVKPLIFYPDMEITT